MALNIFSELNVAAGGDKITAGFTRMQTNWATMDTELYNARSGETTLETRINLSTHKIVSGVGMWFYENVALTGWTIVSASVDTLLAIKGGATYTTGASIAGTWTQPNHIHEMPSHAHTLSAHTHTGTAHNHQWYHYAGPGSGSMAIDSALEDKTWDSDGSTPIQISDGGSMYTDNESGATDVPNDDTAPSKDPGDTAGGSTVNTWRPYAAVGIVAIKD